MILSGSLGNGLGGGNLVALKLVLPPEDEEEGSDVGGGGGPEIGGILAERRASRLPCMRAAPSLRLSDWGCGIMGGRFCGFCGLCSSLLPPPPLEFILPEELEPSSWRCGRRAFSRSSIWLTCRLLRKLGSKLSRTLFTALRLLLVFRLESAGAAATAEAAFALLRGGGGGLGNGCREKDPSEAMVPRDCDRLGGLS